MTTYYYYVGGPAGSTIGVPGLISTALGAVYGGYYQCAHGGEVAASAGAAGGAALACCYIAGEFVVSLAPTSGVLHAVGWLIKWIFGIYFAILAAIGGFVGAGAVWIVTDVCSAFLHTG
jgi:hypothetical protein